MMLHNKIPQNAINGLWEQAFIFLSHELSWSSVGTFLLYVECWLSWSSAFGTGFGSLHISFSLNRQFLVMIFSGWCTKAHPNMLKASAHLHLLFPRAISKSQVHSISSVQLKQGVKSQRTSLPSAATVQSSFWGSVFVLRLLPLQAGSTSGLLCSQCILLTVKSPGWSTVTSIRSWFGSFMAQLNRYFY